MAKRNAAVEATLTLPGITRPVGRPRNPKALTNAQRQKAFRQRRHLQDLGVTPVTEIQDLEVSAICQEIRRQSMIRNMVRPSLMFRELLKLVAFAESANSVTRNGN